MATGAPVPQFHGRQRRPWPDPRRGRIPDPEHHRPADHRGGRSGGGVHQQAPRAGSVPGGGAVDVGRVFRISAECVDGVGGLSR